MISDTLAFLISLRWQDLVDISLNSYILFRLYVLFRGSRLIRVVPVVILLWIIHGVALSTGLVVTSWAIQGIIAAAAVILIIVFRDEIASVFQTRNLKSFLWGLPSRQGATPTDIVAESVFELGRLKVGALLVFPNSKGIDDIVQGGLTWDGKLSREMLRSIFWDKNPVHDGAAIIQGDRISKVGVILPLSRRRDLPSRYGTRHRAGIGLAEVSDCLVVIVSEESGRITVVKGNEIKDIRNAFQLQSIIEGHTGRRRRRDSALVKDLFEYGITAFLCLGLVTGIWFGLSRGREALKTMEVPLEYTGIQKDFEIVEASANTVTLHLGGSAPLLKTLTPQQIKVQLGLDTATVGENTYHISGEDVLLPPGIRLKKVMPADVILVLDGTVSRQLPIQLSWSGKLAEDLILSDAQLEPDTLEVAGPQKDLKGIVTLYTEKIPLESIQESGRREVSVVVYPPSLKVAEGGNTVMVGFTVTRRPAPPESP